MLQGGPAAWAARHGQDLPVQGPGSQAVHQAVTQVGARLAHSSNSNQAPSGSLALQDGNGNGNSNSTACWDADTLFCPAAGGQFPPACGAFAVWWCFSVCCRYSCSQLVEVNAHSLFSKWFSESGKLVSKLFAAITELVEEPQSLVFVLIDEVESLTAARKVGVGSVLGLAGQPAGWATAEAASNIFSRG